MSIKTLAKRLVAANIADMRLRNISILLLFSLFWSSVAYGAKGVPIGEIDIIERVLTMAPATLKAREDVAKTKDEIMTSKSVFDTYLSGNSDYTRNEFQQSSNFFGTRTDTANWDIGLAKKLPSGTQTALQWGNQREQLFGAPTIGGVPIFPTVPTYESQLTFSVEQPLMKNVIGLVDRGNVEQAKKAYSAMDLATQYRIASIANNALYLYWQWVLAHNLIQAWRENVVDAQTFLHITLEREKLGTAEETDVLAAEANLILKKNDLLRAERRSLQIEKDLKIILDYSTYEDIRPRDKTPRYIKGFYLENPDEAISLALENRTDYLALKEDLDRQNINVVNKKNERWPELDLVGTLAVNGLTNSYSNTMDNVDNPYYMIGVTLSFPLENRYARSGLNKAKHDLTKTLIDLKEKENDIANSITELIKRLKINRRVVSNAMKAVGLQRRKLVEELNKYRMGRSSSEMIVLYQNDRLSSEIEAVNAWGDYYQTVLDLKLAENTLIQ